MYLFQNLCSLHAGESNNLYCLVCYQAMCSTCHVTTHKDHEYADIIQYRKQLRKSIDNCMKSVEDEKQCTTQNKKNSEGDINGFRVLIRQSFACKTSEEGPNESQEKHNSLQDELKDAENVLVTIYTDLTKKQKYISNNLGKLLNSMNGDQDKIDLRHIYRQLQNLIDDELPAFRWIKCNYPKKIDIVKNLQNTEGDIGKQVEHDTHDKIIARYDIVSEKSTRDQSVQNVISLKTEETLWSVAGFVLYDDYIVTVHTNITVIYVYKQDGSIVHKLSVPGMVYPRHLLMFLKSDKAQLLVTDWNEKKIHKILIYKEKGILILKPDSFIQLDYEPVNIYMTTIGKLLVCAPLRHRIYKYSNVSTFHVEGFIDVPSQLMPSQVISDPKGNGYVVTDTTNKKIFWIDDYGNVQRTLQDDVSLNVKLGEPRSLIKDNDGYVLITDHNNHQILVFDQQNDYIGVLLREKDGIHKPGRLWLNHHTNRLYIACNVPVRVMVYDYIALIRTCVSIWPRLLTNVTFTRRQSE